MKKTVIICMIGLFLGIGNLATQQEEEEIKETVRVVNVEVPVRVHYHGNPVDNLTKADFKLFENRKRQNIHGFILKRKKIKRQTLELTAEQKKSWLPRYFVLVFRITHYDDHVKKGLEYLFDNILKETDQLLVFVNDRSAFFKSLEDKMGIKAKLDQLLREESLKARNKLFLCVKQIENEVDKHKFEMTLRSRRATTNLYIVINHYFTRYLRIWKDYKKKYLFPDINKYYNFATFLKNIQLEKWVINFYQFEIFPDIMINSESMRKIRAYIGTWQVSTVPDEVNFSRIISRQIIEIEKELSIAKDFPSEEVAKIFHNVDATFHSIFMKTTLSSLLQDTEYRQIATELENNLRAITDRTGGELVVSNNLNTALDTIGEAEDIYYILTYSPKDPDKVGKIKIKMNNRKYKARYSPNLRTGYLRYYLQGKKIQGKPVKIKDFQFKNGKLSLVISDFYWHETEKGKLNIRIQIKNMHGIPVFDQQKTFKATQKEIKISLNISGIKKGKYDFVVDVTDLFTKQVATTFIQSEIMPNP